MANDRRKVKEQDQWKSRCIRSSNTQSCSRKQMGMCGSFFDPISLAKIVHPVPLIHICRTRVHAAASW